VAKDLRITFKELLEAKHLSYARAAEILSCDPYFGIVNPSTVWRWANRQNEGLGGRFAKAIEILGGPIAEELPSVSRRDLLKIWDTLDHALRILQSRREANLMPLIRLLSQTQLDCVSVSDIIFLTKAEGQLEINLTPGLVEGLLKNKVSGNDPP